MLKTPPYLYYSGFLVHLCSKFSWDLKQNLTEKRCRFERSALSGFDSNIKRLCVRICSNSLAFITFLLAICERFDMRNRLYWFCQFKPVDDLSCLMLDCGFLCEGQIRRCDRRSANREQQQLTLRYGWSRQISSNNTDDTCWSTATTFHKTGSLVS